MNLLRLPLVRFVFFLATLLPPAVGGEAVPEPLRPWIPWALWGDIHRNCPTPFNDPKTHRCFWPAQLDLQVKPGGATFSMEVTVYHETWVPLPGSGDDWPVSVRVKDTLLPVLEHEGVPSVQLSQGVHRMEGQFRWKEIPQRLAVPPAIGLLALSLDGQSVSNPTWDAQGTLWLRREATTEEGEKNFLSLKLNSELEDGVPLWWHSELELTVSGQSREEDLGTILPEGWRLSSVESPLPVAVDDSGRMKVQVRAGRWTLRTDAFRYDNPKSIRYAPGARTAVSEQLFALRSRPDFRVVEITGVPSMDVSQMAFPDRWRQLPVYLWKTSTPFEIVERMRGMGDQKPSGLSIAREWWLDESGRGITFQDQIRGERQSIWRLDAAQGLELGSVRSRGVGQLITRNPENGMPGVEVRSRNLDLHATGRMPRAAHLSATGWQSDADDLKVTLHLPPGWRLFALFGADWVHGDWLTEWTLLDLFLLLIFTLALFRLWGWRVACLGFLAFGISYHEPGAPRYLWLLLLVPLSLLRVVREGWPHRILGALKWMTVMALVAVLVPFVARQIQQALYPQLEAVGTRGAFGWYRPVPPPVSASGVEDVPQVVAGKVAEVAEAPQEAKVEQSSRMDPVLARRYGLIPSRSSVNAPTSLGQPVERMTDNLGYDAQARIQTGPGIPHWQWRAVSFGWNGPVRAAQDVRPVLIPLGLERVLTVVRVALLLGLCAALLGQFRQARRTAGGTGVGRAVALLVFLLALEGFSGRAQAAEGIPDEATLKLLRERLLEVPDAYPNAAEIPSVALTLKDRKLGMEVEVHTALITAVPLPGRLPAWSPMSVTLGGVPLPALRRDDGFLWVVLPKGVSRIRVEGSLAAVTDWEWSFLLKPRRVTVDAPDWNVTGIRPDGVPEAQVFFSQIRKTEVGQVTYDRQDLQAAVAVERRVELGLVWQVRTTVRRLSRPGKAVDLRIPLLPGENVLTSTSAVRDGVIEVRLGAQEEGFQWESSLAATNALRFVATPADAWVEQWRLVASPVWNVTLTGLAPIFEANNADLVPVWHPWPGESVALAISRPEAIPGSTMTIDRVLHEVTLGKRQTVSRLQVEVRSSLGEDFLVDLPAGAEVTGVELNGKAIPVRQDSGRLVVPLRPGSQKVSIAWKVNQTLGFSAVAGTVRLPADCANIETTMVVPDDRWVLWASGPRRGPAVRFWVILFSSLIAALCLGRVPRSPLKSWHWMLLVIGLTQVPLPAAMVVIGWFFLLAWRGSAAFQQLPGLRYNAVQVGFVFLTIVLLAVLLTAVGEGLLGNPEMFIVGNGSHRTLLRWYQDLSGGVLPRPQCDSVSIWWYRLAMLFWALWLAVSLIRWLRMAWDAFSSGGCLRRRAPKPPHGPPPASVPDTTAAAESGKPA